MKAKTQIRIGLWGTIVFLVLAGYEIWGPLPWFRHFFSLPLQVCIIIFPIYILGIVVRKGWVALVACVSWSGFCIFFIVGQFYIFIAEAKPDFGPLCRVGMKILLYLGVPWGFVALILWVGFNGLNKMLAAENKSMRLTKALIVIGIVAMLTGILLPALARVRTIKPQMQCGTNLAVLGKAMRLYTNDYDGQYPIADKWCNLLLEHVEIKGHFVCPSARPGKGRYAHYAINPNVEPNSPPELVLLFETTPGWNKFGGAEILSLENHKRKGCNVLFNDGHVEFIKPRRLGNLKWKNEQKQ